MIEGFTNFAAACANKGFFALPTWYKYLDSLNDAAGKCVPRINSLADIWLILAAVIDILLRLAGLIAIGFVVYGGVQYIMSEGQPERTSKARNTIINALVGLGISLTAAALVGFVAGRFK